MEERVRSCRQCRSIIGWYAIFCESCGAKQDPATGGVRAGGAATAGGAHAEPVPAVHAPATPVLEKEVRTHLTAEAGDARGVARDLFQTQLRLIHKNREGVEELLQEVASMTKDLAAAAKEPARDAVRRKLDALSQRMYEAEQRWGELQVAYNRDAEMIEEESREHMEAADFDAYLTPDENAKIEAEFTALNAQFEGTDSRLRDLGRDLARARQESESRYGGFGKSGGGVPWVLVIVTVALVAAGLYCGLSVYALDPVGLAATAGPIGLALGIWLVYGISRRSR